MSSLRNAVKRITHKERGQLRHRKNKVGNLLEKHKDYVKRAKDYHRKTDLIKKLKQKTKLKNPDEFYHGMITENKLIKDKKHVDDFFDDSVNHINNGLSVDEVRILKSQDMNYLISKNMIDQNKLTRLNQDLHYLEYQKHNNILSNDDDVSDDMLSDEESNQNKPKHIIFVENDDEKKKFNPVKYFDTAESLVGRAYNRPRLETLANKPIQIHGKTRRKGEQGVINNIYKKQTKTYQEVVERKKRSKKLKRVIQRLQLQKNLMGKGRKRKIKKATSTRPAVYKWKRERKK